MNKFRWHGYLGLLIIALAEVLLFTGNDFVGRWFTPIVWTGYVFFIDALVFKFSGRSLLVTHRVEFLILALSSIAIWWLFEFYNAPRFWKSDLELWWHYHNLEPNPYLRRFGYDWAFATIMPAMLLTAELLRSTLFKSWSGRRPLRLSKSFLYVMILVGLAAVIVPLAWISSWFAPVIWLSFILFLDPINYMRGWPSVTGDLQNGSYQRLFALLAAGGICGFLWEFWNYWAISRWTYTVPYLGNVKLFEMPILGFLGFPPFAVECWVMYMFCRSLLSSRPETTNKIWLESC